MPTYAIVVRNHHERQDGKYPVYIRLTHNRQSVYMPTGVYVSRQQLKKDLATIKDTVLVRELNALMLECENILIKKVGGSMARHTAKQLASIIDNYRKIPDADNIDFVEFCKEYLAKMRKKGQTSLAAKRESIINHFTTYYGSDHISIKAVNVKNLLGFMEYLSQPHKIRVVSCKGDVRVKTAEGCSPKTIKEYISGMQTLFNAACDKYNDEDAEQILITHNPFKNKKLCIEVRGVPAKRDMSLADLVKILSAKDLPTQRMKLARDVLAISFYLMAMNTADIYGEDAKIKIRRIEYRRQKTAKRRSDEALISVKIEPEVLPLLREYRDPKRKRLFRFYQMYSNYNSFNKNVNMGCKALATHLGLPYPLTSYYIRHTWATLASEECGCSDEEVALALNHIGDKSLRVTRGYIHRRFTKNDINHRKVLDLVADKVR